MQRALAQLGAGRSQAGVSAAGEQVDEELLVMQKGPRSGVGRIRKEKKGREDGVQCISVQPATLVFLSWLCVVPPFDSELWDPNP
jgi:hypothetical protein